MRHTLAIAARELRERWILFPAAFVIGCLPLIVPAFGVKRDEAQLIGVFSAVLLGAAAAVVIGSSMLARDAAAGRLAFLFSRPVSWRAIWGGKWLAALVLVFGSGLLAAVPWMAFYPGPQLVGGSWLKALADPSGASMALALSVLAVGLANFNATAFRSRSAWLVFDLSLLLAAAWAARAYVAPLLWYGFFDGFWKPQLLAAALGLALLAGSAAQVFFGRTDLRRAHRALSLGAWSVVWLALAAAAGTVGWVRAAGPADVQASAVIGDATGRWVYVEGAARVPNRYYPSGYLIDTVGGRYLRAPDDRAFFGTPWGMLFSADGRLGARPGVDPAGRGTALAVFDLTAPRPRARVIALESSPPIEGWWRSAFALSPRGATLFSVHSSGASLYEVASGRRLATTTLQPGFRPVAVRFLDERRARAWLVPAGDNPRAEMRVVDLAQDGATSTRAFATAARLPGLGLLVVDRSGTRIVTPDDGLRLRDGVDGREIARLAEGNGSDVPRISGTLAAAFLADGRVVTADATVPRTTKPRVSVFDAAGQKLRESAVDVLPAGLALGPELEPGRLVIAGTRVPWPLTDSAGDSLVFDANEGRVVRQLAGLRPAVGFFTAAAVPADAPLSTVQFFRDAQRRVLRVDTATGERHTVAGPGAPKGERLRWQ